MQKKKKKNVKMLLFQQWLLNLLKSKLLFTQKVKLIRDWLYWCPCHRNKRFYRQHKQILVKVHLTMKGEFHL